MAGAAEPSPSAGKGRPLVVRARRVLTPAGIRPHRHSMASGRILLVSPYPSRDTLWP